jgi:NADPH:quinone reductase-like Zn-dependent oxidoreductase
MPGAYAEAILADVERLIPLPDDFTFEQGAAFPLQGMTAHYLIHEFRRPSPSSSVLIHAAAGGMGGLLVQWAKHLGANVIGTVSTEAKARTARASGADHVILYTGQDFTRRKGRTEPEIMKKQVAGVLYNSRSHGTGILLDPGRTLCFGSFIDRQKLTRGRLVENDTTLGENLFGDRHRGRSICPAGIER